MTIRSGGESIRVHTQALTLDGIGGKEIGRAGGIHSASIDCVAIGIYEEIKKLLWYDSAPRLVIKPARRSINGKGEL